MAEVHQLILHQGIEAARRQAASKHERIVIEAAYRVMSEEANRVGFTYSGFALTCLPHRPVPVPVWRREGHNLTLIVQSGVDRAGKPIGLPHGSHARYLLLFLQSEAIRTGSREIEMGRTMRVRLANMGVSIGGKTLRLVREQARRISACTLTFYADREGKEIMSRAGFVDGAITMTDVPSDQPSLWQDRVLLNEAFFRALCDHPVPLSESALRAIGPRPMSMDVYIWLAYRLHALRRDVHIGWPALRQQFGDSTTGRLRSFRQDFITALEISLAAYPDARVTIDPGTGVTLHPSRPAIRSAG